MPSVGLPDQRKLVCQPIACDGRGNRVAFLKAQRNTAEAVQDPELAGPRNFAAPEPHTGTVTFSKTPERDLTLKTERWKLLCRRSKDGKVRAREKVKIKRGERKHVDLSRACRR